MTFPKISINLHAKTAITYFAIAATLGLLLRIYFTTSLPFNFRYVVHAHSHTALLGWIYMGLTTILFHLFLNKADLEPRYRKIFWFTQLAIVGMLLTFPFQGYGLYSIIFSTLFLIASYWFAGFFIRNLPKATKATYAYKCFRVALIYLMISTIGPWTMGYVMSALGPTSIWYRIVIYFYLHFQYNGWMIMALLGFLFYILENRNIPISPKNFKAFFWFMNVGIVLTFFLSVLWTSPPIIFYILSGTGAIFQVIAFGLLAKISGKLFRKSYGIFTGFQLQILKTVSFLWPIKLLLELLGSFPYFANLSSTILDFTIGYLHWTFLGVITLSIFLFFEFFKILSIPRKAYWLYFFGFVTTEALIFGKGLAIWLHLGLFSSYFIVLAALSAAFPVAIYFFLGAKKEID